MSLIEWTPALSVGVARLDEQHRTLVAMINELHDAMAARHGKEVVGSILDRLVEYTHTHFKDEEQLLAQQGYPGLAAQKEEHGRLVGRVQQLQEKLHAGKPLVSVEVMTFLKGWLVEHIQHEDARYGPYLNAKGIR